MIRPDAGGAEIPVFVGPMSHQEGLTLEQRETGLKLETGISGFLTKQTQDKEACERFESARQKITKGRLVKELDYQGIVENLGLKFEGPKADSMYTAAYHILAQARNFNAIWKKQSPEKQVKEKEIGWSSKDLADYMIELKLNEEDLNVLLDSVK